MKDIQIKFKHFLMTLSGVRGEKFTNEMIDRLIYLSTEDELQDFIHFIKEDINANGRMHMETVSIMIKLVKQNPNYKVNELLNTFNRLWK